MSIQECFSTSRKTPNKLTGYRVTQASRGWRSKLFRIADYGESAYSEAVKCAEQWAKERKPYINNTSGVNGIFFYHCKVDNILYLRGCKTVDGVRHTFCLSLTYRSIEEALRLAESNGFPVEDFDNAVSILNKTRGVR